MSENMASTRSASQRGHRGWRLILFALVVACAAAVWAETRHLASPGAANKGAVRLVVPADALNIGTVWENEQFEWTVEVENREETSVEVESFRRSCNCLSVEPQAFVLGPGERRNLHLHIDLSSQMKPTGELVVRLWARIKAKEGEATRFGPEWRVEGKVHRALAFDRSVYLGQHSELAQPLPAQAVPIEVSVPLASLVAECDLPGFTAVVDGLQKNKAVLQLSAAGPLPVGEFAGTVSLKPVLKGGDRLPVRRLRFTGAIIPDVQAVPLAIPIGGRILSEVFEDIIILQSLSGRPMAAVRAVAQGEGLSLEAVEGIGRFRIRQKICSTGSKTNLIHFHTQSAGRPIKIIVPVSYTGFESQ
jgi:hypothetical protein